MTGGPPDSAVSLLDSLKAVLGDKAPQWAEHETRDVIAHQITGIPEAAVNTLNLDLLMPLASAFGKALNCNFSLAGEPGLNVTESLTRAEIDQFLSDNKGMGEFRLDLRLEKRPLIEPWFGKLPEDVDGYLYLYPKAAQRDLLSPIGQLEAYYWPHDSCRKVILFIPDVELDLNGELLAVLGGKGSEKWRQYVRSPVVVVQNYKKINQDAQNFLKWQQPWVSILSPAYLQVSGTHRGGDDLVRAIQSQFVNLFLLYSADRTIDQNGRFISTYSGGKYSVEIDWGPPANAPLFDWEDIHALGDAFSWAYNPTYQARDRLPVIQINIAKTVRVMDHTLAYGLLVKSTKGMFIDLDGQWNEIVENRIDAFSDRKDKLADQVHDSADKFTNQITEMISNLSTTALALVAVLIGTFIAALFQDKFNPSVFTIGMYLYAGYVFIFPLLYNMINQWIRFKTQVTLYERDVKPSVIQLEESTIKQIVGDAVPKTIARFQWCFWITVILYLLLVGIIIYAAVAGPGLVSTGTQPTPLSPKIVPVHIVVPTPIP